MNSSPAEAREPVDHRQLGRELEIFTTSDLVGAGFPLWLPDGATVRQELADFVLEIERAAGYQHVMTPVVAKEQLYERSGHLRFFADEMFPPITLGDDRLRLRPVNCPHHVLVYRHAHRSYRDLPLRIAELGAMFRLERSGVVGGLSRVRGMTLNDAHIFCALDDLDSEIDAAIHLIEQAYRTVGIGGCRFRLSLRSPEGGKWAGNEADWRHAEAALNSALRRADVEVDRAEGEAAFYGPKIDVQVDDALGREFTLSTVQVDFWMPQRFDLAYTGADGDDHRPVMVHRSMLSTAERLVAFLLEEHQGALPLWLAPQQVALLPVTRAHEQAAQQLADALTSRRVRCAVLSSDQPLSGRVRLATSRRVPYVAVIGDHEIADGIVTVRVRGGSHHEIVTNAFVESCHRRIEQRDPELEPLV